ncbi:MAG: hypothetical protein RIR70_1927 [Pseudomonadota bacterium]|jgi:hypothetical protein
MMLGVAFLMAVTAAQGLSEVSDEELKQRFMACDEANTQGAMDDVDAMICSTIYESLKERVFAGSSQALLQWWQEEKTRRAKRP